MRSLIPVLAIAAAPAAAQQVTLDLTCLVEGAPAQMVMAVEYQQAFDPLTNFQGKISGLFPAGVTIYTAGTVSSATSRYSFRGENDFADFTDLLTYQQFRVQWVLDPARNGVWMKVNPFGGTVIYFCELKNAR